MPRPMDFWAPYRSRIDRHGFNVATQTLLQQCLRVNPRGPSQEAPRGKSDSYTSGYILVLERDDWSLFLVKGRSA